MPRRTVAVFTATRAEYGLLRNSLHALAAAGVQLRLVVGGTHLSPLHGMTVQEIVDDGLPIDVRVPMDVETNDDSSLVRALAQCAARVGDALCRLRPDALLILGDRYELVPAASAATVLRIPIIHVSGGDLTDGAIDNQVRHAVTKMAHLHLPGTQASAERIIQMGEAPERVVVTGEPGLDDFVQAAPVPRDALARDLGLDPATSWVLFTYHPETMAEDGVDEARVAAALGVLAARRSLQTVLTAANADRGGDRLNRQLHARAAADPARFRFIPSLGHARFVATMRQAHCVVGNSSAGVVEAASVPVPAIDIGDRQKGRLRAGNVIWIDGDRAALAAALDRVADPAFRDGLRDLVNPYGDGHAAARIAAAVKDFLDHPNLAKPFFVPEALRR